MLGSEKPKNIFLQFVMSTQKKRDEKQQSAMGEMQILQLALWENAAFVDTAFTFNRKCKPLSLVHMQTWSWCWQ